MTVKKKGGETVTPVIGTDTKSLIWPAGFFPQVDETPSPRAGIPPLLCVLSDLRERKKKDTATLYPLRPTPEKKTLRTVISGTNIFLIDTHRDRRERELWVPAFPRGGNERVTREKSLSKQTHPWTYPSRVTLGSRDSFAHSRWKWFVLRDERRLRCEWLVTIVIQTSYVVLARQEDKLIKPGNWERIKMYFVYFQIARELKRQETTSAKDTFGIVVFIDRICFQTFCFLIRLIYIESQNRHLQFKFWNVLYSIVP